MDEWTVYEDQYFAVMAPRLPLNSKGDGGHLILTKKDPVTDRSDMTWQEAVDFVRVSMAVGRAMYDVLGIERMNYEDLGNWGVDDHGGAENALTFLWQGSRRGPSDSRTAHVPVSKGPPNLPWTPRPSGLRRRFELTCSNS